MGRVNARRVIAGVADQHCGGICSGGEEVGNSVSLEHPAADLKQSVALLVWRTVPNPARFGIGRAMHLGPKAFDFLRREGGKRNVSFSHDAS
jgi:hypothetical protein